MMRHYFHAVVKEWRNKQMKDPKEKEYGVIIEQGDLGLGFDILNEQDQEIMKKNDEKEEKSK